MRFLILRVLTHEISDPELQRDLEADRAGIIQALDAVLVGAGLSPLGYGAPQG